MTNKHLVESSQKLVAHDGEYKVVLITPGRGSSGYYSEEMLRATGPDAFPKGTHSYIDHLNEGEKRTTQKLVGVTTEDAYYEDGVGVVAKLKPFSHWREFVSEVAPYVGMSISAEGAGEMQEMDGEEVFVVESLVPNIMNTVDLVSYAGRGGHIAEQLAEAAISTQPEPSAGTEKKDNESMAIDEKTIESLTDQVAKLVSAHESAAASKLDEDAVNQKVAEARDGAIKAAVAAARKVAEAELTEKQAERLYAQIESGDFEIEDRLTEYAEVRDEVKESLNESAGFTFGRAGGTNESAKLSDYAVGSWKR